MFCAYKKMIYGQSNFTVNPGPTSKNIIRSFILFPPHNHNHDLGRNFDCRNICWNFFEIIQPSWNSWTNIFAPDFVFARKVYFGSQIWVIDQTLIKYFLRNSRSLFVYLRLFKQLTITMYVIKLCQWLESNHGSLVLEATALPTEAQPLPVIKYLICGNHSCLYLATFGLVTVCIA